MAKKKTESLELVYSVPKMSRLLGVSDAHGYKLVREGIVPSLRLKGRVVVPKAALDKLLACEDQLGAV